MITWLDAQLSPTMAEWITANFDITAFSLRELGLRDAMDGDIFFAAGKENAIVMTKDSDFIKLLEQNGAPPKVIWLTCGNTSNARLKQILFITLEKALEFLESGEQLVEINSD